MPSCHSEHDLVLAVQDLLAHLPQDNIKCLINSMPDRVVACIAAGVFEFNKEFGDKYSISDFVFLNKQLIAKEKSELVKDSIKENKLKRFIRVIIDTGSRKSYITKYLARKMKLKSDAIIDDRSCLYEKNSDEIHLLIGVDYAGKLLTGKIKHLSGGLVAVHTLLGWAVMGKSDVKGTSTNSLMLVLSLHVNDAKITDLSNLDTLSIKDCSESHSKTETQELALNYLRETLDQDSTSRYKVNLSWLEGHPPLPDNKELARKRLKSTVKSLKLANRLNDYQEVFNQWEREAVFKDNSTTKVRPVFDGSAKMRNFVSINECIEKGPSLIEMIPAILNRFRWGKIGVIADIKQAFLQIALKESDRDFLRFMGWKDGDPQKTVTYRHCHVVF
ncbi:integrase catalytic domain-containing protein [Trichonephila clavipes]|nr:integrase catalytic domain-containing protein [Trichonephila clavipes]